MLYSALGRGIGLGGALGIYVIVVGNKIEDPSSNIG